METPSQPKYRTSKSGEQTVMNKKPAGDETGEYYIPVSNLPFQIKWQNLKDWIRERCPGITVVVQVFRPSTTGWIKVWGRQNFETVFRHVNGAVFHGRAILASGRNATEAIHIKELIRSSQKKNPLYSAPRPFSQNGESSQSVQTPSQEERQIPEIQIHVVEDLATSESASSGSMMSSPTPNLARLMPVSPEPVFPVPNYYPSEMPIEYGHHTSTYYATGPERFASDCIQASSNPSIPVLRLIQLYNLPIGANKTEVDAWIKSTAGPRFVQIELISIPDEQAMHTDDTFQRTASVICKDAHVSKVLLSILNGAGFSAKKGEHRTVRATLPATGITAWEAKALVNDPSTTTVGPSLQNNQAWSATGRV